MNDEIDIREKEIPETKSEEQESGPSKFEESQDATPVKPKKAKKPDIKWKDKITKVIGLIDRIVKKKIGGVSGIANEDKQLVADEWAGVLEDYGVDPPRHIKLLVAIIVTVAVVLDSYWVAIGKLKAKFSRKGKTEVENEEDSS